MDEYLLLSLIIMGAAIGALLVIWGGMSLYFHLRKKHRAKLRQQNAAAREAAEQKFRAEQETSENSSK